MSKGNHYRSTVIAIIVILILLPTTIQETTASLQHSITSPKNTIYNENEVPLNISIRTTNGFRFGYSNFVNEIFYCLDGKTNVTVPFFIGAQQSSVTPPAGLFSAGYRDEFSFFNIALSPAQRAELYNGGKPNDLSQHSAAANLTFWDRQGDTGTYLIAVNEQGGTGGTVENMESEDITTETP